MAQEKETTKTHDLLDFNTFNVKGRILAMDPGTKRIGIAVSDEMQLIATPLPRIERRSWKKILSDVSDIVEQFDAKALVIGLPLESDGTESEMSLLARDMARKFSLSLGIPVFLQDERTTSYEAKGRLWEQGVELKKSRDLVDSEAASIILNDFLLKLKPES